MSKNYKEALGHIDTLIFDVDGVFTDNSLYLIEGQQPMRKVNVKDGYVVQLLVKLGYRVAIITGGRAMSVKERFEGLGVKDVFLGSHDKMQVFKDYARDTGLDPEKTLYMGDDVPDHGVMQEVGLACCPQDATAVIKEVSQYVSPINGGHGCVRDIVEQMLRLHGHWMNEESKRW